MTLPDKELNMLRHRMLIWNEILNKRYIIGAKVINTWTDLGNS